MAAVTMRDAAQKAHVSIKTVSRVVNDQGEISEKTHQRVLTATLVGKGHTAIGMLAGRAAPLDKMQRVQGFREALMAHGLVLVDEWILAGSPILECGHGAARQLLTQHPRITAIFTYNELVSLLSTWTSNWWFENRHKFEDRIQDSAPHPVLAAPVLIVQDRGGQGKGTGRLVLGLSTRQCRSVIGGWVTSDWHNPRPTGADRFLAQ